MQLLPRRHDAAVANPQSPAMRDQASFVDAITDYLVQDPAAYGSVSKPIVPL